MSAILSADDLNDFISPGVACIKPVESLPNEAEVVIDGTPGTQSAAQISLTDCLACSGCVTSAEAVLVSLQSHAEVIKVLDTAPGLEIQDGKVLGLENPDSKLFVASVSHQVCASLAAAAGISSRRAGELIETLLSGPGGLKSGGLGNGFDWVIDISAAREACLELGTEEVLSRPDNVKSPIICSSCPGWVCYAEKTHPYVLPHLSRTKSPQALLGTLLKTTLSKTLGISPDRIWHLAVMPCFDKKLEASRAELTDDAWAGSSEPVRDVDCVITTGEILKLAELRNLSFFDLSPVSALITPFPDARVHEFLFSPRSSSSRNAGTSGGSLHHLLTTLISQNPGATLVTSPGRNPDIIEYIVQTPDNPTFFKAARCYGFRNIQNLVRKLKPAKVSRLPNARSVARKSQGSDYGYVEVMACPGGCTNGGGQLKAGDDVVQAILGQVDSKALLARVDEAYFSDDEQKPSEGVLDFVTYWEKLTGIPKKKLVYTTFREVVDDLQTAKNTTEKAAVIASRIGGGW